MNFLPKQKHKPDLEALDRELSLPPREPDEFAPKRITKENLPDLAIKVIKTFGALPTTELDEMIHAMEVEVQQIKTDAEQIKADYFALTSEMVANIKRLTSGCSLAKEALATLRTQVSELGLDPKEPMIVPVAVVDEVKKED